MTLWGKQALYYVVVLVHLRKVFCAHPLYEIGVKVATNASYVTQTVM